MKSSIRRSLLGIFFLLCASPAIAADWWTMPDVDFVNTYKNLATGTQAEQSSFAWMVFARANQKVQLNGSTYSQWELWASDPDTFAPNVSLFAAAKKIRTRPHLQQSALATSPHLQKAFKLKSSSFNPIPQGEGEEVTRNALSYDYIMGKKLNTAAGIAAYLAAGSKIDFPIGTVETKAYWVQAAIPDAYQITDPSSKTVYSLTGIHLMTKIGPQPANPFTDNTPSWFWTTFEFKGNPGLSAAQKLITYGDTFPATDRTALLTAAGLNSSAFVNYACNGPQIQFDDAKNPKIILGNTQIEWFLATPTNHKPDTWKSWSSSCHSCHAQASGNPTPFNFTGPVGPLTGADLPGPGYKPFDFVWALFRAQ